MRIGRRIVLYFTAFACGWVMMGLEILGGRILSPDFGSGVYVWGSVIGVFLLSLSIGYLLGGGLSSRFPSVAGLIATVLLAAVSILPVGAWYPQISGWFADLELNERWGALLAAGAMFLWPSIFLGMVSPYCIRLLTESVDRVGSNAGTLYAVSTVGSFLGCIHTAFYLITWLGIHAILWLACGILSAVALILWVGWWIFATEQRHASQMHSSTNLEDSF